MNIPIYKQEIADGLSDQIANNAIACVAVAESDIKPSPESVEKLRKIIAQNNG